MNEQLDFAIRDVVSFNAKLLKLLKGVDKKDIPKEYKDILSMQLGYLVDKIV